MKDKRGSVEIDISLLKNWIDTNYSVYARDIVTIDGVDMPLVISVSMRTNYIVSLGTDMIYNGPDITKAFSIFNSDIDMLKTLKDMIPDSQKDKVTLFDKENEEYMIHD